MAKICGTRLQQNEHLVKYHFSAAAAAISFLQSIPRRTRSYVRNIILNENRKSVGSSESHVRGLVPFCIENLALKVHRRVDVWRAIFPGEEFPLQAPTVFNRPHQMCMYDGVSTGVVTNAIATWITEAMALPSAGMPSGSFSLHFNTHSSQDIFEVLKRGAAWQSARQESYARNLLPPCSIWNNRKSPIYISESFPGAIRDIIEGKSSIDFDVSPRELWNIEDIIGINRGRSEEG